MNNNKAEDNQSIITQLSLPNENRNNQLTYDNLPQLNNDQQQLRVNEEQVKLFNMKKIAKSIPLPTTDAEIKLKLREIGEPIIIFGEKPYERSDRLKQSIESLIIKHKGIPDFLFKAISHNYQQQDEEFYTEGNTLLLEARKKIVMYSLPRSAYRIEKAKSQFLDYDKDKEKEDNNKLFDSLKNFEFTLSQIGDERGCSHGMLCPDGNLYGVAGWSGVCNIFSINNLKLMTRLVGHSDRVNSIKFHPGYESSIDSKGPCVLTASDDCTIRLWSLDIEKEIQRSLVLKGHEHKVISADYHPMGTIIGSCSVDKTVRFWDIIAKKEFLIQEGHSSSITCLSFQSDGALLASADQGGIGLVWDLRNGKIISALIGHAKQISSIKFSSNCYNVATGSDDNTLRFWDLRKNQCLYSIPAHTDIITDINFEQLESKYIITTSFDSRIKIWNVQDWSLIKSYESNEDKLLSISINKEHNKMITCSFGKTIKLWNIEGQMIVD